MPIVSLNGSVDTLGRRQLTNLSGIVGNGPANPFAGVLREPDDDDPIRTTTVTDANEMRRPYGGNLQGFQRLGFVVTTDWWLSDGAKAIEFHVGPSSANWMLPLRSSSEDTKSGQAHFVQQRQVKTGIASDNRSSTIFANPRVSFEWQAGNILPFYSRPEPDNPSKVIAAQIPYGLEDFYAFMSLMNQPPIIPTGDDRGKTNYVWIYYTSVKFPQMVLKGFIEQNGTTFSDSVDAPTSVLWTTEFIVHEMTPSLWEFDQMRSAWSDYHRGNLLSF